MKISDKLIYRTPRILGLGYLLFLSLFSLDVFTTYSGADIILPLFMHLIPSILLLLVVIISWKYELIGAIIFLGFAIYYVFAVGLTRPIWILTIAVPAALTGLLYLISWKRRRQL